MEILIVEDEKTVRKALRYGLQKYAYSVYEARNPVDALDLLQNRSFDMIIMDLNMPILSGLDLVNMLREKELAVPIIVLTSEDAAGETFAAFDHKYLQIMSKDLPLSQILESIRESLETS